MALFPVRKIQDGGRRPPPSWKNFSNGHISATGRPIHSMFGSRVGFSGTADLMALFPIRKIQDGGHRHFGKISKGLISATGRPIHSMFRSRVGFSGTADLMALFPVRTNPRWRPPPSWKNFKWSHFRNRSSDPLHAWFWGWVFGGGGSDGTISANHMYGHFTCCLLYTSPSPRD